MLDLCPQGNVSQILLGGTQKGSTKFFDLMERKKTVMGYFLDRARSPYQKSGTETDFLLRTSDCSEEMPENLYLVAGDTKLDLISQSLDLFSNNNAIPGLNTWKATYSWLIDLQEAIKLRLGDNTVFFIDTNPSFSSYTKLGLLSADRLIVPCFSDVGSLYALNNIMYLLYDINESGIDIGGVSFAKTAKNNGMSIPLIFMTLIGKSTIYKKDSAIAFSNLESKIKTNLDNLKSKYNGKIFVRSAFDMIQQIHDMHLVAPYVNLTGKIVTKLKQTHKTGIFSEDGREMQIGSHIEAYKDKIQDVVGLL